MTDIAVGAVTVMASGALALGIKLLFDLLGTSTKRCEDEIARMDRRHEADRAEWHAERAEMRKRIDQLEALLGGVGGS